MTILEIAIPEEVGYLLPIGDVHAGDKAFGAKGRRKLKGYIDWVKEHINSRVFLMGDIFNCATRASKTSPFDTNTSEYDEAKEIFAPIAGQIIGGIDGNHEYRAIDYGFPSPVKTLCEQLGIPYCGYSAALKFRIGRRPDTENQYWQIYWAYAHHTTGGGNSLGGALNRVVKLQEIVSGMDLYLGGHNHQLVTGTKFIFVPGMSKLDERKIHFVDCGSYLDWDNSYAEKGMMAPGKLGSPRIRFEGTRDHHDIHVSI